MRLNGQKRRSKKSLAFVSNDEGEEDEYDLDTDEGLANAVVLLGFSASIMTISTCRANARSRGIFTFATLAMRVNRP